MIFLFSLKKIKEIIIKFIKKLAVTNLQIKNKTYISNKIKKIFKNDFRINILKSLENIYYI